MEVEEFNCSAMVLSYCALLGLLENSELLRNELWSNCGKERQNDWQKKKVPGQPLRTSLRNISSSPYDSDVCYAIWALDQMRGLVFSGKTADTTLATRFCKKNHSALIELETNEVVEKKIGPSRHGGDAYRLWVWCAKCG